MAPGVTAFLYGEPPKCVNILRMRKFSFAKVAKVAKDVKEKLIELRACLLSTLFLIL